MNSLNMNIIVVIHVTAAVKVNVCELPTYSRIPPGFNTVVPWLSSQASFDQRERILTLLNGLCPIPAIQNTYIKS
jgi:hypothetical protein